LTIFKNWNKQTKNQVLDAGFIRRGFAPKNFTRSHAITTRMTLSLSPPMRAESHLLRVMNIVNVAIMVHDPVFGDHKTNHYISYSES
jgi:hypothetical protein